MKFALYTPVLKAIEEKMENGRQYYRVEMVKTPLMATAPREAMFEAKTKGFVAPIVGPA